jgi:hypothetical protein
MKNDNTRNYNLINDNRKNNTKYDNVKIKHKNDKENIIT